MAKAGLRRLAVWVLAAGVALPAGAQEAGSVGWFACPYVDWWNPPTAADCPRPQESAAAVAPAPAAEPEDPPAPDGPEMAILEAWLAAQAARKRGGPDEEKATEPGDVYPLFPPQSLAADAPDLFAELLAQPAIDKAKAYWLWYEKRQARLIEVQKLIAEAGRQIAIERGLPVGEYEAFFLETHGPPESLAGERAAWAARRRRGATLEVMPAGQLPLVPAAR